MAVKDNHYLEVVRAVIEGNIEHARSLFRVASSQASVARPSFARSIDRLLGQRGQMIELQRRGKWDFGQSLTTLDSLILTGEAEASIARLIREHEHREQLAEYNLFASNKVLLEGPPGNGKTSLAMGIANSLSLPIVRVSCHDVIDSYMGESGRNLKDLFNEANQLPCILFLDEIDGLSMSRGGGKKASADRERVSITTSLFILLDQLLSRTIFLAATNRPQDLDPALVRRFDLVINVPAPDTASMLKWVKRYRTNSWPDMPLFKGESPSSFARLECEVMRRHREWVMQQQPPRSSTEKTKEGDRDGYRQKKSD